MKKFGFVVFVLFLGAISFCLAGCDSEATKKAAAQQALAHEQKTAVDSALATYAKFRKETRGDAAQADMSNLYVTLTNAGLGLDAIHVDKAELTSRATLLYRQNANTAFGELKRTHGKLDQAKKLGAEVKTCTENAGQSVSPALERKIALEIGRNMVEEGKATRQAHAYVQPRIAAHKAAKKHSVAVVRHKRRTARG